MDMDESAVEDREGKRPAEEIRLASGRLTLFWPLTLHMDSPPGQASVIDYTADGFARDLIAAADKDGGCPWRQVKDPLEHYPRPQRSDFEGEKAEDKFREATLTWENEAYAEAIYFHEFVQDFLYREHVGPGLPAFHLFRRDDIRKAAVAFGRGKSSKTVEIERVNLYIFRTGVAIFTMDMVLPEVGTSADCGWSLAEFEDFHDYVRRAYAPYFEILGGRRSHGELVIDSISWLDKNAAPILDRAQQPMDYDLNGDLDHVTRYIGAPERKAERYPPVFRHWRALLPEQLPLAPYQKSRKPAYALRTSEGDLSATGSWHHVVDERMPTLAMVNVADENGGLSRFKAIRRGDFVRLCFADASGSDRYPHDRAFFKDFEEKHCYDRFYSQGTRYLVSGYSFVGVYGSGFAAKYVSAHLRRHYFQMALMAHMEVASLLGFSGQISRAVQSFGSEVGEEAELEFERSMAAIQEQFLLFVHRFRFTGVSNQVQAQELFDLWRKQLRSQELFEDVRDEISVANDYLQARADRRTSEAGEKLAVVGAIAVLIGTVVGLLGMNFFFATDTWKGDWQTDVDQFKAAFPAQGFVAGLVMMFAGALGYFWFRPKRNTRGKLALAQVRKFAIALFGAGIALAVIAKALS